MVSFPAFADCPCKNAMCVNPPAIAVAELPLPVESFVK